MMHHVIEVTSATVVAAALAAALVMLPRPKPEVPPEQTPVEIPLRPSINELQPPVVNKQVVPETQDDKLADIEARLKEAIARTKRIETKVDERAEK